jgi:hypothetical protein
MDQSIPPKDAVDRLAIEIVVSRDDRERLSKVLDGGTDLEALLRTLAEAGASEMISQATGRAVFSSITDLRLFRLYCLIGAGMSLKQAERLVPILFKVPARSGRGFVERALARYDVELDDRLRDRVRELIKAATWNKSQERWEIELPPGLIVSKVMDAALDAEPSVPDPVPAQRGRVWRFADETYRAICGVFGAAPQEHG